jgi:hypothetical protein
MLNGVEDENGSYSVKIGFILLGEFKIELDAFEINQFVSAVFIVLTENIFG